MTGTEIQKPNTEANMKDAISEPTTVFMEDAPVGTPVVAEVVAVADKTARKPKAQKSKAGEAVASSGIDSGSVGTSDSQGSVRAAAKQKAMPAPVTPGRASAVKFFVSRTSVFSDGYDMERERLAVLQLISRSQAGEEIPASDPLYDRWMLYEDRFVQFAKLMAQRQTRAAEPAQVTRSEVTAYKALGTLANDADEGVDTIELHTKEAFLLFLGRATDPDAVVAATAISGAASAGASSVGGGAGAKAGNAAQARIISFKKVGASYRMLSSLSANNNDKATSFL